MSRNHTRLHAARWRKIRITVLNRDGWRCRACGLSARLEVDHVVPLQWEPGQDPYALDGLQALCKSCHIAKTREENLNPDRLTWQNYVDDILARHGDGPE